MSQATMAGDDVAAPLPSAEALGTVLANGQRPPRPGALAVCRAFAWRAMLKIKHVPEQLFDVTAFPIILTLLFTYLLGGALAGSVSAYIQYLLPGVMVMSVLMTTMYTGVSVNLDNGKGLADRFRTLPIWRPAPMVGYLIGDAVRYLLGALVILALGLILGFRPQGGLVGVVTGVALLVVFAFAFSWLWTMLGLLMRSDKAVMSTSLLVLFPLTFLSNILVQPRTMPGWLQAFVDVNPVTQLVAAVRGMMAGEPNAGATVYVLVASAVLLAVFGTLTMRLYNRR